MAANIDAPDDPYELPQHQYQASTYLNYQFDSTTASAVRQRCSTGRDLCNVVGTGGGLDANFVKGVKWSPDGTCLLSSSNDNILRVFDKPPTVGYEDATSSNDDGDSRLPEALAIKEPECVYDTTWFPGMTSSDPTTCVFLSSVREHSIRLWDAYTGALRCSYVPFDHLDQVQAPNSLTFNLDGSKIYAGFTNHIQIFATDRPGRDSRRVATSPSKKSREGQKGLVSTIAFNPDRSGLYACGSYAGTVGLYDERNNELLDLLCPAAKTLKSQGGGAGFTQVEFSPCGTYLYAAARKSSHILCWDVRKSAEVLRTFSRAGNTNQRMSFSLGEGGRWLASGDTEGYVVVFDTGTGGVVSRYKGHEDVVSACGFHPSLPVLATSSGQRRAFVNVEAMGVRPVWDEAGRLVCVEVDVEGESDDQESSEDEEVPQTTHKSATGMDQSEQPTTTPANQTTKETIPIDSSIALWTLPHTWVSYTWPEAEDTSLPPQVTLSSTEVQPRPTANDAHTAMETTPVDAAETVERPIHSGGEFVIDYD